MQKKQPIQYVAEYLDAHPSVREKMKSKLIKAGHTGINDQEAWSIVENEFIKPYQNKIFPKEVRDSSLSFLFLTVPDDDVVSLIMYEKYA